MSWIQTKKSLFQPCDPLKENHWIVEFLPAPGTEHYHPHPPESKWKYYIFGYVKENGDIMEVPVNQTFEIAFQQLIRGMAFSQSAMRRHYRLRNIMTNEIIPGELFGCELFG